jgi:hypothetical protein
MAVPIAYLLSARKLFNEFPMEQVISKAVSVAFPQFWSTKIKIAILVAVTFAALC